MLLVTSDTFEKPGSGSRRAYGKSSTEDARPSKEEFRD